MKYFLAWLPLAITITLLSGLMYAVGQQIQRQGATSSLVALAETTAEQKDANLPLTTISSRPVNIATSLEPFVIVYDESRHPTLGSGLLDGQLPTPPDGVFSFAATHLDNRLTWQPQPNIREAIVVKHFTGSEPGFVLAGQSLRETEREESNLASGIFIAWIISCLISYAAVLYVAKARERLI